MVFTHVVNGDRAATLLDEALALPANIGRRDDRVVVVHDDLSVGPLRQIDESAEARVAFWQRVLGAGERGISQTIADAFAINDHTLRGLAHDDGREIVLWHTRHTGDQLMLRRMAYRLRTMPQRLNEIALPTERPIGERTRQDGDAAEVHALALGEVNKGLRTIAPISILRISRLALEWQELKQMDNDVRHWQANTFISGTFAEIDTDIMEATGKAWMPYLDVAEQLRRHAGSAASDAIVGWRCRELAITGRLALDDDPVLVKTTQVRHRV